MRKKIVTPVLRDGNAERSRPQTRVSKHGFNMSLKTVANICFHGVGEPRRDLEEGEGRFWVQRDSFTAILDSVAERGDITLSFDDGNISDVDVVLPELTARGLRATFYVVAGRIGRTGSLGPGDLASLVDAGMEIGTHGMHHVPWRHLPIDALEDEIVHARRLIEDVVGRPVRKAALPLGRYDRVVLRALREHHYEEVASSDRCLGRTGSWLQPRFSVTSADRSESVMKRLEAAGRPGYRLKRSAIVAIKRRR